MGISSKDILQYVLANCLANFNPGEKILIGEIPGKFFSAAMSSKENYDSRDIPIGYPPVRFNKNLQSIFSPA